MNLSLDHFNPNGIFNTAIREFCEGNPEPLALYIEEHGISPGHEAKTFAQALREPKRFKRRANQNNRMSELIVLYEAIYKAEKWAKDDPEIAARVNDETGEPFGPFKSRLIWKEERGITLRGKVSIYQKIAKHLNVTPSAVEQEHKRMKRKRKTVAKQK